MLYRALVRFLRKEKGIYTVTLINRSHLILPRIHYIANCIRCKFLITQFLTTEALGKNALADRR